MEADEAIHGKNSDSPLKLFITTASEFPVNVNISAPMANAIYQGDRFTIKKGTIQQVLIPKSLRLQGTERAKKAIHIVSSAEIVVFGLNQAKYSTDGFLGIPLDVLGTKYFVPSFFENGRDFFNSAILIVGTQDRTILNIKLPNTNNIRIHFEGKSYSHGDWMNLTINKYDTLQLLCRADLTGTLVLSSKKVSVFGGSTITSVGIGSTKDHIEEHIPPVNVWGKKFAINPIPDTNPNILRFLASEDNTMVNINNKEIQIMAGNYSEAQVDRFSFVSANKPILTVQYVPSGTCPINGFKPGCHKGDPSMTLISPTEQNNLFYSFLTPVSSMNLNYSNIFLFVIEDGYEDGIFLDNSPIKRSDFHNVVHNHNITAGYIRISPGSHTIEHSSKKVPFGGILYGGIEFESYAFPVGQRFATINEEDCRSSVMSPGDGLDNDCDGQVDEEVCNDFKDNDKDGKTDEDCSIALSTTVKTTSSTTITTTKAAIKFSTSKSIFVSKVTTSNSTTSASPTKAKLSKTNETTTSTRPAPKSTTRITKTLTETTSPLPIVKSITTTTTRTTPSARTTSITVSKRRMMTPSMKTARATTRKIPAVTTMSSVHQNSGMDEDPERPVWLSYTEYGIIGCVSVVVIGVIGLCCKRCFGLLAKRSDDDDDDEEEKHRRKMYNKARKAIGPPAIRPMYIELQKT
ncbi:uncharacterized protein LOC134283860 [Saccostrea cucullata]|uniref:uncharacterized protein LOC134283860 n=1 Tax=Saccostrea cuccullata TaxID=36930 RepID=UPI002ED12D15